MATSERTPTIAPFRADFESAVQRMRGALTELYASVGADPGAPQTVARELGINRNLSWKVGKIIHSSDAFRAYPHLPAAGSFARLLRAFEKAGAPASAVAKVRAAQAAFEAVVQRHAGKRETLDLMVLDEGPHSESSRKLAFQGNSAIWGVQARVRMLTQMIAPNADHPELMDNAMIGGVYDYRRLRPGVAWPLGQRIIHVEGGAPAEASVEPIDPGAGEAGDLPLMRAFCSSPIPKLRNVQEGDYTITELCEGPVGNTGALSCVFGWIHRAYAPIGREGDDAFKEYILRLDTPVEIAMLDLLVHREFSFDEPPRLCLYSLMHGRMQIPLAGHPRHHLPCAEPVEDLGSGPPVLATPHVQRYPEMVQAASERLGRDLSEFHGYRFTLTYPPIPTIADLYYELPDR